jgi:septal ring factor EnvC (AmiA/AmiB activator)
MKRLALAVLLIAASAAYADDLVDAARAAKAKRKKSTTHVITNADVKKAKGTVTENKLPAQAVEKQPESLVDQQARMRKERATTNANLAAAQRKVEDLEKEAAALEQRYYEENDLDRRDGELVKRFNDVKARLDTAYADLDALAPQQLNSSTAEQPTPP